MKQLLSALFLCGAFILPASAAPLSNNAHTVIPSAVQQIISVDYRDLRDSQTAQALRDRVMPDNIKQFENGAAGRWHRSQQGCRAAYLRQLPRAEETFCTASASRRGRSSRKNFSRR